ncbi:transmembrane protein 120A isoform X1 [Parus major]|uniref:transmembrane protein 120A isoform X1 n=1 Tax=Parus major TaxID=9157 RepID=UPI0008F480BB|nr:transmembrane protein 120A isoform X1 [Parus major]
MAWGASLAECLREWEELQDGYQRIQDNHKLYKQKLEELTKLQDGISSSIARQKKRLKELSLSLKKCKPQATPEQESSIQETQSLIKERQNVFFEMEAYLPKKNGLYLSLVLGNVNVTLLSKQAKFAYKDEYEKFKLYLTIILLIVSFSCRFVLNSRVTDAVFNFLLVWYYCTLTIRESILINNGSKIKGWWVFHHYISTFLSGVMLTWPDGLMYQMFRNQFLSFSMYQSFVQFLQYYYQSGCLYRLRALGERHNMDLTVVLAALQRHHPVPHDPAPRVQGVAGPHVRPPLLHPLPGQLLHHPPCRPPEDSEQEPGHKGELKWGSVGAWTVSPHQLHPLSPSPQFRPDSGVSSHSSEAWMWDRSWGLLLDSPCAQHGAGSVLESLTWSQEHPAPPLLAASHIQTAGCLGQPLPSLFLGCSVDVPTPVGQGRASHGSWAAPGPPCPPSPAPRAAPVC